MTLSSLKTMQIMYQIKLYGIQSDPKRCNPENLEKPWSKVKQTRSHRSHGPKFEFAVRAKECF